MLLAAAGTDDLSAGQVALSARRRGWPAVPGEPWFLRRLDATVTIEELP